MSNLTPADISQFADAIASLSNVALAAGFVLGVFVGDSLKPLVIAISRIVENKFGTKHTLEKPVRKTRKRRERQAVLPLDGAP